jgi:hypothetical protein
MKTPEDREIDWRLAVAWRPSSEPSPQEGQLYDRIAVKLTASIDPVTPEPAPWVTALLLGFVCLLSAAAAMWVMRAYGMTRMNAREELGIASVLLFGLALAAISLAWQVTPASLSRISAPAAIIVLVFAFAAGAVLLFPWSPSTSTATQGWNCLGTGLLVAGMAAGAFLLLLRRSVWLDKRAAAAALGALAGLAGAGALQFHCVMQEGSHLLVSHGGILLISILAGAILGQAAARHARGA